MSMIYRPWILPVYVVLFLIAGCLNKDKGGSASDASVRVTASAPPGR